LIGAYTFALRSANDYHPVFGATTRRPVCAGWQSYSEGAIIPLILSSSWPLTGFCVVTSVDSGTYRGRTRDLDLESSHSIHFEQKRSAGDPDFDYSVTQNRVFVRNSGQRFCRLSQNVS
jgi:hypothetical protein